MYYLILFFTVIIVNNNSLRDYKTYQDIFFLYKRNTFAFDKKHKNALSIYS